MNPRATVKNATCISRVVGCAVEVSSRAMMLGIERGDSPRAVLNLHQGRNASLLSPSRTRLVSRTFGERPGEGSSRHFKCCWFCISRVAGSSVSVSPSAMMPGIERGDSPGAVLNLHRSHNASLLSPSRTCLVSRTFGERSGEGPSNHFKCCSFSTPSSSIQLPRASQHTSPNGAAYFSPGLPSLGEATLGFHRQLRKANPALPPHTARSSSVSTSLRRCHRPRPRPALASLPS